MLGFHAHPCKVCEGHKVAQGSLAYRTKIPGYISSHSIENALQKLLLSSTATLTFKMFDIKVFFCIVQTHRCTRVRGGGVLEPFWVGMCCPGFQNSLRNWFFDLKLGSWAWKYIFFFMKKILEVGALELEKGLKWWV